MAAYASGRLLVKGLPAAPRAGRLPISLARSRIAVLAGTLVCLSSLTVGKALADEQLLFERDVLPILTAHCLKCHGLEARKAGLDLRTAALIARGGDSGPALEPGALEKSPLYARMADRSMPPKGELPLGDDKIEIIRRWIASGAKATAATERRGLVAAPRRVRR